MRKFAISCCGCNNTKLHEFRSAFDAAFIILYYYSCALPIKMAPKPRAKYTLSLN